MAFAQAPDAGLQDAFIKALKTVDEQRKRSRSTMVECTEFFTEFKRYDKIEPYVSFFKAIGVTGILDDRNRRHYIAFQLDHNQLLSMGYKSFLPNDRVVIVFTTDSKASTEITSFKVTLLNSDHL